MRFHYTDKEKTKIIKSIVILVDTREQKNAHITDFLDKKKVKYVNKKLDCGDYSFYIPKDESLGIYRDIYFDKDITVERKASLDELAGNLTKDRERFTSEMLRKQCAKMHLLIEDASWEKLNNGDYRSKYKPSSFMATLYCYMARYNITIDFLGKDMSGEFIYCIFYYFLREALNEYFDLID